jgi:hypothetical protein
MAAPLALKLCCHYSVVWSLPYLPVGSIRSVGADSMLLGVFLLLPTFGPLRSELLCFLYLGGTHVPGNFVS